MHRAYMDFQTIHALVSCWGVCTGFVTGEQVLLQNQLTVLKEYSVILTTSFYGINQKI